MSSGAAGSWGTGALVGEGATGRGIRRLTSIKQQHVICAMYYQHHHIQPAKKALLYLETKYTGDWFCLCTEQAILCLDGGRWDVIFSIPELLCCSSFGSSATASAAERTWWYFCFGELDVTQWLTWIPVLYEAAKQKFPVLPYKGIQWWRCEPAPSHRFSAAAAAQQSQAQVWILVCCDNQLGFGKSLKKNLMFWQRNKASERKKNKPV